MAACLKLVRFGPNFFADRIVVALGITKDTVRHLPDGPFENGSRILISFLSGTCRASAMRQIARREHASSAVLP
jgi:hypothetical protein